MKNEFNSILEMPKLRVEDVRLFGKLLFKSRSELKKSERQVAAELSLTDSTIQRWEQGDAFPEEDRLPIISKVYGIDLEKLSGIFKISKEARANEKITRKKLQPTKLSGTYNN